MGAPAALVAVTVVSNSTRTGGQTHSPSTSIACSTALQLSADFSGPAAATLARKAGIHAEIETHRAVFEEYSSVTLQTSSSRGRKTVTCPRFQIKLEEKTVVWTQ